MTHVMTPTTADSALEKLEDTLDEISLQVLLIRRQSPSIMPTDRIGTLTHAANQAADILHRALKHDREYPDIRFGSFRLHRTTTQLWDGEMAISLRPRSFAVLRYLAMNPCRLISHDEFRDQVWEGLYVTPTVFRVCVRGIRQALGDSVERPMYIETIRGYGYGFLGTVDELDWSRPRCW